MTIVLSLVLKIYGRIFRLPKTPKSIEAIVYSVPIHMLAYYTAVELGNDVDQPRNLAKSVTVE